MLANIGPASESGAGTGRCDLPEVIQQLDCGALPSVVGEPVDCRRVLLVVDQREEPGTVLRLFLRFACLFIEFVAERLSIVDRDMASGCRQVMDAGEGLFLRGGGQIDQQPFGQPRRRPRWIESAPSKMTELVPEHLLSRVFSFDSFGSHALTPVGFALAAGAATIWPVTTIVAVGGALGFFLWFAPLISRRVRHAA